jgi:nitrate reductase beta subunit
MRWKRQQLEEMLEAEQSRTVQLEARRTAMEKAGRACMHPLLRYSLDQEEQQQQQMKNSKSNDSQLVSSSKDQQQDMYSVPSAPPHVADQYMEAWVQEYQNEQKQPLSHVDDTLWPSSSSTGKEMTRDESENTSSSSSSSSSSLLSSLESESSDDDE